jgi:hypothetical protein
VANQSTEVTVLATGAVGVVLAGPPASVNFPPENREFTATLTIEEAQADPTPTADVEIQFNASTIDSFGETTLQVEVTPVDGYVFYNHFLLVSYGRANGTAVLMPIPIPNGGVAGEPIVIDTRIATVAAGAQVSAWVTTAPVSSVLTAEATNIGSDNIN